MTALISEPPAPPACTDCAAPLAGPYCAACGQKAEPLRQPTHHFVRDAAAEALSYDGRVWRTFAALLVRPGALTVAYAAGRRQRYLRPLRVYLTSTLLFFFLLSTVDPVGRVQQSLRDGEGRADSVTVGARLTETRARLAGADSSRTRIARLDSLAASVGNANFATATGRAEAAQARDAALAFADSVRDAAGDGRLERSRDRAEIALLRSWPRDSVVAAADLDDATAILFPGASGIDSDGPAWLTDGKTARMIRESRTAGDRADAFAAFSRSAIRHVPTVMFLLLPLFALMLKALYARRGWTVAEHVVFGLHTHAFAFIVFAVVTALAGAAPDSGAAWSVSLVLVCTVPLYVVLAQKRVYGQSWRKTLVKAVLLGWAYATALLFGLVGVILLAAVLG